MLHVGIEPSPLAPDLAETVQRCLAQREVAQALAARARERSIRQVYLVGCGGSFYSTFPAQQLLGCHSRTLSTVNLSSAELTYGNPAGLDEHCLVVASSHSGGTPETVRAAERAKQAGALLAGIARVADSPLGKLADAMFTYQSDVSVTEPKALHFTQVAYALLEAHGELSSAQDVWSALDLLPAAVVSAKTRVRDVALEAAAAWRDAGFVYVLAAGPNWGAANALASCYLQEMNWLHASAVHAADFFHGPFEIVGERPVLLLAGDDEYRPISERAIAFTRRYYQTVHVVDAAALGLDELGASPGQRRVISPLVVASAARRLSDYCAAESGHNSAQRRYMYRVEY